MLSLRHYAAGMTIGLATLVTGCAEPAMPVPPSASLMMEGNGDRIMYRAPEYGRVYVMDPVDRKVVYSGDVQRGDAVEINAIDDRVQVAGRTVFDRPLQNGRNYQIYFEPLSEERVVRQRTVEKTETVHPPTGGVRQTETIRETETVKP